MKLIISLGLLVFAVILMFAPAYAMGQLSLFENPTIGKSAPDFTLKTVNGEELNMTQYRNGSNAIIFFWATWCPHCRGALEKLNQRRVEMEEKGIKLIIVDLGEDEGQVHSYMQLNNIGLDVFIDEESSLVGPYGISGVPTFCIINKEGIIKDISHELPEDYGKISF